MGAPPAPHHSRKRRGLLLVLLAAAVLLVIVSALLLQSRKPLRGGVRLGEGGLATVGARLYLGDRPLGAGVAEVSWDDVFGHQGAEPLVTPIPLDMPQLTEQYAAMPDHADTKQWAEWLAGEEAQIVHFKRGSPGDVGHGNGKHVFHRYEVLLRRADGRLDQVFGLDGVVTIHGRRQRFIVPIRPRAQGLGGKSLYFTSSSGFGSGSFTDLGVTQQLWAEWGFEASDPPPEFANEIAAEGLWEPPAR